jgi:hypothetical protein
MCPQSKKSTRRGFVFLFFLFAAIIAWFINKLSKEYPYQLSFTACVYSSTDKASSSCANNLLQVRLRAKGFYIMKHLSIPTRLNIDIKNVRPMRTLIDDHIEYSIPTRSIQGAIITAISSEGVTVEHVITESLFFDSN